MLINLLIFFIGYYLYFGLLALPYLKNAGKPAWQALIPIFNLYLITKVIDRPWYWTLLAIIPGVGNIMLIVMMYELMHVYRFGTFLNGLLAALTFGLYFGYLGYTKELKYQGRDIKDIRKHVSELASSIIFAIVAATVIRAFTFEAFTIPTPSMEKSLMVGDFLFVSKAHYGVRMPMTPFALPLVHNKVPASTTVNSYLDALILPYFRLPPFFEIEHGDPVVFNYPAEDIRFAQFGMEGETRPIDKREHYVKRAIGLPGDTFKMENGIVYLNGAENMLPDRVVKQMSYIVYTTKTLTQNFLKKEFDVDLDKDVMQNGRLENGAGFGYVLNMPVDSVAKMKAFPFVTAVEPQIMSTPMEANPVFPNPDPMHGGKMRYRWTRDNYGPLYIPAEGKTIELNADNYYKYQRVIRFYENNDFAFRDEQYLLNGMPVTEYTFQQNYYFMLGDNRHGSDDSRYWGFVPEDHIVGKPVFIWMSYDKYGEGLADKIRFDRIFTTVNGSGERQSYFWYFIGAVFIITVINKVRKKKKDTKAA